MKGSNGSIDAELIAFWDKAFAVSEDEKNAAEPVGEADWKQLAPSEKLFAAAASLGKRRKVLDYGCGSAWAGIIAAKSGCPDVTAVDPAPGAAEAARFTASLFGAESIRIECTATDWLNTVPDGTFDGFICSNVLDVVPPETAAAIIREAARAVTADASVIIGLNYYLSPEAAAKKAVGEMRGNMLFINGVLRLVSLTDEEWERAFAPWFTLERLEHFAWPGEPEERRRLFFFKKRVRTN